MHIVGCELEAKEAEVTEHWPNPGHNIPALNPTRRHPLKKEKLSERSSTGILISHRSLSLPSTQNKTINNDMSADLGKLEAHLATRSYVEG